MTYLINSNLNNNRNEEEDNNIDYKYIFLGNTINNRILENAKYTRIYYSTPLCSFNGIYILMNFDNLNKSNSYNLLKHKITLNVTDNLILINKVKQIEETILSVIDIENKSQSTNISDELMKGFIKLNYCHNYDKIMLKISGLWETETNYGLTYKYYYVKQQ
jgi:hypothetical protein